MADVIARGTIEHREHTDVLRFTLNLPQPVHEVWPALATPAGLREWLAVAEPLEPRLCGAVTLRWQKDIGDGTVAPGTVTAWDLEHVAEYTVAVHGRIRFHLAPAWGTTGTVLRFTNEVTVPDAAELPGRLAAWHQHLESFVEALDGTPQDWSAWTPDRYRELYAASAYEEPGAAYEAPGGRQS